MHAAKNTGGVEQVLGKLAFPVGRSETEHIGVGNGAGTEAGPEDVPIHADNAGHGAAVRVKS